MKFNTQAGLRLLAVAGVTLTIAACTTTPKPPPPGPVAGPPTDQNAFTPPQGQTGVTEQQTAALPGSAQDFVISAGDRVFFDYDAFVIRPDAADTLAKQADWLRKYSAVQVRIEGNADERGTREYNFALGERRANSVKDFLVSHGVDAGRITTVSYGKERPIDPGDNEDAWAKNRNAHTAITAGAR